MRRLYLELKNQRLYFFVPPVILFILVPLTVLASTKGDGGNFPECATISQLFIPSFAVWWPLFILKEYLNAPGKELLFVYKSGRDSLFFKMIGLWAFFVLHVLMVFVYFSFLFDFVWFLFIVIIIQSLFLIALGYFLSLLFQNTFIPLIINFAYSSVFMLVLFYSPLSIFEIGSFNNAGSLSKFPVVAIIAFILFYGGHQIEKHLYADN
ncbi:hypothetical protein ABDB91_00910 [Desulfoscipio sp. XC116]|uniref:hypothetical protein n=1 Tax=Desulfoscipio sp. XC116 TaxID=3144975 RepID=UPI00325B4352